MENFSVFHNLPFYIGLGGYLGIFLFFISLDQLTPVPEEIRLLTIGYMPSIGLFHPAIAGAVAMLSFLTVDNAYYVLVWTGRKSGRRLRKKMESPFLNKIKERFSHNFPKTLFVLCFIPRMRLWAPVVSGILQVPYRRFILFDSLSLALFTSFYVTVGLFFHRGMLHFLAELETMHNVIFICFVAMLAVVLYLLIQLNRHGQQG